MNINRKKTEKRTKQIPYVKTIITELKNSWEGINSRLEEGRISIVKGRPLYMIQSEEKRKNKEKWRNSKGLTWYYKAN